MISSYVLHFINGIICSWTNKSYLIYHFFSDSNPILFYYFHISISWLLYECLQNTWIGPETKFLHLFALLVFRFTFSLFAHYDQFMRHGLVVEMCYKCCSIELIRLHALYTIFCLAFFVCFSHALFTVP